LEGKFEEGAREMRALEVSELQRLNLSDIEARVELLVDALIVSNYVHMILFSMKNYCRNLGRPSRFKTCRMYLYACKTVWKLSLLRRKRSSFLRWTCQSNIK
jgi:hypothetical protein